MEEVALQDHALEDGGQGTQPPVVVEKEAKPPWSTVLSLVDLPANHPVFDNIRKKELGKLMIAVATPIMANMCPIYHQADEVPLIARFTAVFLVAGVASIFFGLLLTETMESDIVPNLVELMGIMLVLVGFFIFAAFILPGKLAVIPGLFCMFSMLAVVQAFFPKGRVQMAADAAPEI